MAASWSKVRHDLRRDPKVIVMARIIFGDSDCNVTCDDGVTSHIVTDRHTLVTHVTVSGLIDVWAAIARVIDGDNHHPFLCLSDLDKITGIKGFGEAMAEVGWVMPHESGDGLFFPNFQEFNTPNKVRTKEHSGALSGKERTARYRQKLKEQKAKQAQNGAVTCDETVTSRDVTGDVTISDNRLKDQEIKRLKEPPPPTPRKSSSPHNREFQEAAEEMISCGVQFPRKALESAFANGATLEDISNLCAYFRSKPGAWGPGALHDRVLNFLSGRPANDHWPEEDPKYLRDQRLCEQKRHAARAAAERETKHISDNTAKADREQRHGAYLDRLTRPQLVALINDLFSEQFQRDSMLDQLRRNELAFRQSASRRDLIFQRLDQIAHEKTA